MRDSCHVITSFVLALGIASAHANEPRILNETVVGEISGNNQPVSPAKTNEIVRSVGDASGENQLLEQADPIVLHSIDYQISADVSLSQIFTDPITPRIATSLKSLERSRHYATYITHPRRGRCHTTQSLDD